MDTQPYETAKKIMTWEEVRTAVVRWRLKDRRIVFTNGCFDLLHLGHIDYLEKAKALGGKLIVGLNSNDSVTRLKGASRPVNDISARARMLAALQFVDAVVEFPQDTPLELIRHCEPDVLVKGDDYKPEDIVGGEFVLGRGGEIKTVALVEGFSSTALMQKIRNS